MPPFSLDRLKEEERTNHIRSIVVMLRPHNSRAMTFLHCSNARSLGTLAINGLCVTFARL